MDSYDCFTYGKIMVDDGNSISNYFYCFGTAVPCIARNNTPFYKVVLFVGTIIMSSIFDSSTYLCVLIHNCTTYLGVGTYQNSSLTSP